MTTHSRPLLIPKKKIDNYSCCLAELNKTTYEIKIKDIYESITIPLQISIKNNGAQSLPNTIKFVNFNSNKIRFKEEFITFQGKIEKNIVFNISIVLVFPNDISPGQYIINSKLDLAYLGSHNGFTFFINVLDTSYDDKLKQNFIKQNQYDILFNKENEKISSNNLAVLKNKKSKYENLENERRGRAIIDKDDKSNIESTLFNKSTTSTQLTKGDEVTKPKINPIKDSHLDFLNKNNNSSKLNNNKNAEIIQNLLKKNKQLTEEKEKLIQENEKLSKDNKIQKKMLEKAINLREIIEKEIKKSENLSGLILNYKNQIQEKNTQNNEMIKKISELTQNIKILTDENEKLKKDKANSNDSNNFLIQFEEIKTKLIEAEKTIKMMNDEKENLILNYKNQIQEKNTQNNEMIKKISELTQNINKIIQSYQNQQQNLKSEEKKTLEEMNADININNKSEKELFPETPTEDYDYIVNKF